MTRTELITGRFAFAHRLPVPGMRAPLVMAASPDRRQIACKGIDG
jgi:hypothetical protein